MANKLFDEYVKLFKEKKIKLTDIRLAILRSVASRKHFTINELITEIEAELGSVNVMSVYNNIDLLLELDLLFSNTINGKQIVYEAVSTHVIHVKCHECGSYEHLDGSALSRDLWPEYQKVLDSISFEMDHFKLELHGICKSCQEAKK